jgi:hypothetical protein
VGKTKWERAKLRRVQPCRENQERLFAGLMVGGGITSGIAADSG